MKILMVCLGNICRSPLAEGILKSKLTMANIFVDSAGTSDLHQGELPDERSIEIAKKYDLDITKQRSRKFTVADFDTFNYIYVMDASNYNNVISLARTNKDIQKVKLILEELPSGNSKDVPDPYYGGDNGFEQVYKMLDEACTAIVSKINNR